MTRHRRSTVDRTELARSSWVRESLIDCDIVVGDARRDVVEAGANLQVAIVRCDDIARQVAIAIEQARA